MAKHILQHWHFYQPRNNDKWTNIINNECYKPNSKNGILNHVSFNIGPTLINWLKENDKETLERMIQSDNGQAIAMPYNHRIMPLIRHEEDIKTQIIWGKKYFQTFFKREPEGIWLPETATSRRVCKELAKQGIKYTIGAPWQKKGEQNTSKPYKIKLEKNLEITYLFYNPVSGKIAFNNPTDSGNKFLDNVDTTLDQLEKLIEDKEMLLLAYDGETFGHHHKFADLWAEYFPKGIAKRKDLKMITIAEYLKEFKAKEEADIWDNSAWSCLCGGLKRWTTGCNCVGGYKAYQQPLLKALEKLEDKSHEIFANEAGKYFKDIWAARNDYIELKLESIKEEEFFKKHLKKDITKEQKKSLQQLLEAEYHIQLSFTSCGWFFPNLSVQTEQNMLDAYTAASMIKEATKKDMITPLLKDLTLAEDWIDEKGKKRHVTGRERLELYLNNKI
ncbi:MAG: DUF3536 domain-containing protein [Nanoarchaeota archaeon]|nr:DUF3536 domain-containing protein [Nanoarchaeota archaeon]